MLRQDFWLCVALVFCMMSVVRPAVMEYSEPDIEADTSGIRDDGMGGSESDDEKTKDEENGEVDGSSEAMDNVQMSGKKTVCKTSANCIVTETLKEMAELLKELGLEIQGLKETVATTCSGSDNVPICRIVEDVGDDGSGDSAHAPEGETQAKEGAAAAEDGDKGEIKCKEDEEDTNEGSGDEDNEGEEEGEEEEGTTLPEPTLPPPPESCPPPFQLLASSCYYIQTDAREWRSWGEAQSFCQQQSGTLAAPYRTQDLREYLQLYYTSVFWVGARHDNPDWVWLNGNKMVEDDWKAGMPSKHPSKLCVYLDYWNNYKGVSHFCGEKFSFICEYREV